MYSTSLLHQAVWFSCTCSPSEWRLGTEVSKCPACMGMRHYGNVRAIHRLSEGRLHRPEWLDSFEVLCAVTRVREAAFPVTNRVASWLSELWSLPDFGGVRITPLEDIWLALRHPDVQFCGVLWGGDADATDWKADPLEAAALLAQEPMSREVVLAAGPDLPAMLQFANIDPRDCGGVIYDLMAGRLWGLETSANLVELDGP